jgi:hypothetical protein
MVAEYRPTTRTPRRSRKNSPHGSAHAYMPDKLALGATIRALWQKEHRLGSYAPVEEVCLDLDELDIEALRALRARVLMRLRERVAAKQQAEQVTT